MKSTPILLLFLFVSLFSVAQNPSFDETLAKKLGADEYGMKRYVLVILKTGANKTENKTFVDSCFAGHMKNIGKLVKENKLIVAGPLVKNDKSYRGIFILNLSDLEEARLILQTDPAIFEKLLEPELYSWYGSAALPMYLESDEKVRKKNF